MLAFWRKSLHSFRRYCPSQSGTSELKCLISIAITLIHSQDSANWCFMSPFNSLVPGWCFTHEAFKEAVLLCHTWRICHSQNSLWAIGGFLKEFNTALPLKWLACRSSSTSTSVFQHWYFGSQVHCVYEGRGVFSPSPPWEFPSVPDSNSLLEPQLYICVCVCVCVRMYTHFRAQLFTFQCA